jgi:flavin reductase (DIM6/NTAB) family NADH-FMN oxidoreductase RutF
MSVDFIKNMEVGMESLHKKGAFLTVAHGDTVNTMTISWGNIGYEWNRPIFTVMVRKSRYTYELIEKSSEFTVSIPLNDGLKEALSICGTKSGRDINKFEVCNLQLKEGRTTSTPVIGNCELHYECKIVYKSDMNPEFLDESVKSSSYKNGDLHTMYYGEIVNTYLEEK